MLLHALAITIFGAPSAGSREGRAMWGSLQVMLPSAFPEARPNLRIEREIGPAPSVTKEVEPPIVVPPLLDRIAPPEPRLEMAPMFQVPPPTKIQAAPTPLPPEPKVISEPPAPPLPEPPKPMPEPIATPPLERAPIETLVVPALPSTPLIERAPVQVQAPNLPAESERAPPLPQSQPPLRTDREPPAKTEPALPPSPYSAPAPSPDSLFKRPAEPSRNYDPTAPSLDMDAIRKRAGQIAREGSGNRAILPFPMPPVPPKKSKMETAIENARKPDCRDAYKALGLAAVVPLIANEFGEGNCRW